MPPTSTCPEVAAYEQAVRGQLAADVRQRLADHLGACVDCARTVSRLLHGTDDTDAARLAQEILHPGEMATLPALPPEGLEASTPAGELAAEACDFLEPPAGPGELGRLGVYRVLRVLGAGGMGIVFAAEDTRLRRLVALKTLRPTLARSAAARERFLREARSAARVEHDHVIVVHDVGEAAGVPFLAMPLLQGETLEARLAREPRLPVIEAVRIAREAAEGLAAAHERGVIHRDVKPSNLWVEAPPHPQPLSPEGRGEPSSPLSPRGRGASSRPPLSPRGRGVGGEGGRVKILDFGLARSPESDGPSAPGVSLGTPAYLPPELSHGGPSDARGDLFSLGCVLYRMLTGELPFRGPDRLALLLDIDERTPTSPRRLNRKVPRALASLTLRLLARDPAARPASAAAVAAELAAIERKLATPPRRPRWQLVLGGGLLLAILIVGYRLTQRQPADTSPPPPAKPVPPVPPPPPPPPPVKLGELARYTGHENQPRLAVFVPGSNLVLSTGGIYFVPRPGQFPLTHFALRLWDRRTGKEVRRFEDGHTASVGALAVSADGKRALSGSVDQTVRLWDLATGKCLQVMRGHRGLASAVLFLPDGRSAVSGGGRDGTVRVWDLATGRQLGAARVHGRGGRTGVVHLALLPGGRVLSAGIDGVMKVWDLAAPGELFKLAADNVPFTGVGVSPDGTSVFTCSGDGTVRRWDLGRRAVARSFSSGAPAGLFRGAAFSADCRFLLLGARDHSLRLWDVAAGKEVKQFTGHTGPVRHVTLSADGPFALSAAEDGTVRLWRYRGP